MARLHEGEAAATLGTSGGHCDAPASMKARASITIRRRGVVIRL